ncbi:MAG: type II secretion system F family protein [Coriobacteriales bacterium]|jgi:type IV pilus assembly protein PilC|nr:type II secretion system F family protein [Coriobacteriales bacterium]
MPATKELSALQLSQLFANLELTYHSGLALSEGFDILATNESDSTAKALLRSVYQSVTAGDSLSEALQVAGGIPQYALSLLRIGEKTGRMEETCKALASYYEKRDALAQSVRSALVYPLSMMVMVFVVVVVLLTQAMPVFEQVFAQLGFTMSGFSAWLLAAGQALSNSAFVVGGVLVALIVLGVLLYLLPAGRRFYHRLFESFPLTRDLSQRLATQRFALGVSTLLHSGLNPDEALGYVQPLIDDRTAARKVAGVASKLADGEGFQEALETSGLFPPDTMTLLTMGFRTGTDAEAFDKIGQSITLSTERRMESLIALIEPTLIGVMCVLVGVILFSVMLPLVGVLTSI